MDVMASDTTVTAVVLVNGAIALLLILIAWKLWRLKSTLAQVNWMLEDVEYHTRNALKGSQDSLVTGQQGLQRLRGGYRRTSGQLQQLQRVLLALGWVQGYVGRRRGNKPVHKQTGV